MKTINSNVGKLISVCTISATLLTSTIPAYALTNPSEYFGPENAATSALVASTVNNAKDIYILDDTFDKVAVVNLASIADTGNTLVAANTATSNVKVSLNGKGVSFSVAPFIQNNTLYVPAKQFGEMLGMTATLSTGKVILKQASKTIVISTSSYKYTVNGQAMNYVNEKNEILGNPIVKNNTIMIPFNTLPLILGLQANWDANTNTATALTGKYIDLAPGDESYPFILDMIGKGAISATGNKVNPDAQCTAEQFLKIFLTASGYKPTGTYKTWSEPYIKEAISRKLIVTGEFTSYSKPITNAQAIRIAVRSVNETYPLNISAYATRIKDYWNAVDVFRPFMLKAYSHGLIGGLGDAVYLRPNELMKRFEACMLTGRTQDKTKRYDMVTKMVYSNIQITVNNKTLTFANVSKPIYNLYGQVTVPIEIFSQEIGAGCIYRKDDKTHVISYSILKNNKRIELTIGDKNYIVDGVKKQFEIAPDNDGVTYERIPLKDLVYALGATEYKLDVAKNTIKITMPDTDGTTSVANGWDKYKNPKIPQRLYDIPANNEETNILKAHFNLVQSFGSSNICDKLANLAKDYMETMNNINYSNVPSDLKTRLLTFFSPYSKINYNGKLNMTPSMYIDEYIADFMANKIIQEAKFITDPSLVYNHKDYFSVARGTLYFRFSESSNQSWLWPGSTTGKWYQIDMEIKFHDNKDGKTCFDSEHILYKAIPMEDKIDD